MLPSDLKLWRGQFDLRCDCEATIARVARVARGRGTDGNDRRPCSAWAMQQCALAPALCMSMFAPRARLLVCSSKLPSPGAPRHPPCAARRKWAAPALSSVRRSGLTRHLQWRCLRQSRELRVPVRATPTSSLAARLLEYSSRCVFPRKEIQVNHLVFSIANCAGLVVHALHFASESAIRYCEDIHV